jgi:hypothetical protein
MVRRTGRQVDWLLVGRVLVIPATVFAAGGCSREEPEGSWPAAPELAFEVTADLGGADAQGPDAIGKARAAVLLPTSSEFVVADGSTQEIHYFSRSGSYLRTIGGRGGGPGEFRAIRVLEALPGGDLCVWDVQQSRVTSFDSTGELKSTARADLDDMKTIFPRFVDFAENCSFILRDQVGEMGLRDEPEEIRQDSVTFVLFDPSGTWVRSLATVADTEKWLRNRDGTWGRVDLVFGEELLGFVSGSELWVGRSGELAWQRIDLQAGTSGSLELGIPRRGASAQDVEAERRRRLAAIEPMPPGFGVVDGTDVSARLAAAESAGIRDAPARDQIPAYDRIVSGWDGSIWIREYPAPGSTEARWVLMSADGEWVGHIVLPRTTTLLDASYEWLLTGLEDELGAPVIRVMRRLE